MGDVVIDARGLRCPLVALTVKRYMRKATKGQRVTVVADDKDAAMDLKALAVTMELKFEIADPEHFLLEKTT